MSAKKIQSTKNYNLFTRHEGENRTLDIKKHKKLLDSMKLYGFLPSFPIVCYRDKAGNLVLKDGQHRLAIAQALGLAVYWVEESIDFDVAVVNSTAKTWVLKDYAEKHAACGLGDYQKGLDFAAEHKIPVGTAFSLLAGTTSFTNCQNQFIDGTFKVKDQKWADAVAGIYRPLVLMNAALNNQRFIEACMGVCRVPSFESKRLIHNAERCREKLVPYSTKDAYLDMLETVYNFGRAKLVGLKAEAVMAMRERNVINVNKKTKAAKEAA